MSARAPLVRWGYGRGLGLAAARQQALVVEEDEVRLRTANGTRVLAGAGEVVRAVWCDPPVAAALTPWSARAGLAGFARHSADEGAVVLLDRADRPVASWLVFHTTPGRSPSAAARRRAGGSDAVARALGIELEPAGSSVPEARALRSAQIRPPEQSTGSGMWLPLTVLAGVLSFLCLRFWEEAAGAWWGLAALAAAAGPVIASARGRLAFLRLAAGPPAGDAVRYRPGAGAGEVLVSPDEVGIITGGAVETWMPGPSRGGVSRAVVGDDEVHLVDDGGFLWLTLDRDHLLPDDAAHARWTAACSEAGVVVVNEPVLAEGNAVRLRPTADEVDQLPERQRGDLGVATSALLSLGALLLLPGALLSLGTSPALGWLVMLGDLAWIISRVWQTWTWRRWRAGVVRTKEER